jgi:acyl phosphate:glycerol-3-phosphate acyltransferase
LQTGIIVIIWSLAGFFVGSIPFALIIGKLVFKIDIRNYGDGNPGATNLWKAKSFGWGAFAYFFDFFKGALPAGICFYLLNITDWGIVPIALAPIAGHAFSPFLRFNGGKAIATTYGVWAGLTFWEVPVFLALSTFFFSAFQKVHSWIQFIVMVSLLGFILLRFPGQSFFYPFIAIWMGNFMIIVIKHAGELHCRPEPQPWILKLRKKHQ